MWPKWREIDTGRYTADEVGDGVRGSRSEQDAVAMMAGRKKL